MSKIIVGKGISLTPLLVKDRKIVHQTKGPPSGSAVVIKANYMKKRATPW